MPKIAAIVFALLVLCFAKPCCSQISGTYSEPIRFSSGERWQGNWLSQRSGHQGKLSATFRRINDHQIRADFRGTFAKIIPFRYPARLNIVHEEPGLMILSGRKRLGPIMGEFRYEAIITPRHFSSTYRSKRDWGNWTLSR